MLEVTSIRFNIFGELKKFKLWLETPNLSLENLKPIVLLRYSYGKELVINELKGINRIQKI